MSMLPGKVASQACRDHGQEGLVRFQQPNSRSSPSLLCLFVWSLQPHSCLRGSLSCGCVLPSLLSRCGLRMKVLHWCFQPLSDLWEAREGRFSDLFLPMTCCYQTSVPADGLVCFLRCDVCHQWERCHCALQRHKMSVATMKCQVDWLEAYNSIGLKRSHPLEFLQTMMDLWFLCEVCAGDSGIVFRDRQPDETASLRKRKQLKVKMLQPPSSLTNAEIHEHLRLSDLSAIECLNHQPAAQDTRSHLSLAWILFERQISPSSFAGHVARAGYEMKNRFWAKAAILPVTEQTDQLPWVLLALKRYPLLFVGTSRGNVLAYSVGSIIEGDLENKYQIATSHADIACLGTSSTEDILISCSWGSGDILLQDLNTAQEIGRCAGHGRFCRSLESTPANNSFLLSSSYDKTIRLWDLRTSDRQVLRLSGHTGSVTAAHFVLNMGTNFILSAAHLRTIPCDCGIKERQMHLYSKLTLAIGCVLLPSL